MFSIMLLLPIDVVVFSLIAGTTTKLEYLLEFQADVNFRVGKFSSNTHDPDRHVPCRVLPWTTVKAEIREYLSAAGNVSASNPIEWLSTHLRSRYKRPKFASEKHIEVFIAWMFSIVANHLKTYWQPDMPEVSFDFDNRSSSQGAGGSSKQIIPDVKGFVDEDGQVPIPFMVGEVKTPELFAPSKDDLAPDLAATWARGIGKHIKGPKVNRWSSDIVGLSCIY